MERLKVLISAYACEPGRGSEPGVGWNVARSLAAHHDVWVITRANNRPAIEAALATDPVPGLRFVYYDLPRWARFWKRGLRGLQLYYYLWQVGLYPVAKQLHREVGFDVAQHVTFVKYWAPSLPALLGVPFVWGPVGGGESAPSAFHTDFSARGRLYERLRDAARGLGERDPLVRLTARRSHTALATTPQTAERLYHLKAPRVIVRGESGLNEDELAMLGSLPAPEVASVRFVSIGRLLHWKGFHLGVRAFAEAGLSEAEYWIIGDGPERARLEVLAKELGVADQVRLFGRLPRHETLRRLGESHALVHPSLHDSGGWVCIEAMAARRPVLCLDLGGPSVQVTADTGFKVPPHTPGQVVEDLAGAMRRLHTDPTLGRRMGEAGRARVCTHFSWTQKAVALSRLYAELIRGEEAAATQAVHRSAA